MMILLLTTLLFAATAQQQEVSGSLDSSSLCNPCMFVAEIVKEKILTEATIGRAINYTNEEVCPKLKFKSFEEECDTFVDQIIRAEFEKFKHMDAYTLCTELKFCSNSHLLSQTANKVETAVGSMAQSMVGVYAASQGLTNQLCFACEEGVRVIHEKITDESWQKDVELAIDQVCKLFGPYKDSCKETVQEYLPMLIMEIEELTKNPTGLCTELHMCSPSAFEIKIEVEEA